MKVRCVNDSGLGIPEEIRKQCGTASYEIPLILHKEYVVYAITKFSGSTWYSVFDESGYGYPAWISELFFEISDDRLSRYWIFSLEEEGSSNKFFLGIPEWAKDPYFYGRLVDWEEPESGIFAGYKTLMDREFPNEAITEVAEIGDERWLMCGDCIDAWESVDTSFAMVACPKCSRVRNNPCYANLYPHN